MHYSQCDLSHAGLQPTWIDSCWKYRAWLKLHEGYFH